MSEVIAYKYHAALYCVDCGADLPEIDPEGNEKWAITEAESVDAPVSCDTCHEIIGGFPLTEEGAHYVLEMAIIDAERVVRGERPNDGYFRDVMCEYGDSIREQLRGHQVAVIDSVAQYDPALTAKVLRIWKLGENNGGELPGATEAGGYPVVYVDADGGELCAECADETGCAAPVVGYYLHMEGPAVECEGCGVEIESAYGCNHPDIRPHWSPGGTFTHYCPDCNMYIIGYGDE